jgi:hypothetical protein
MLSFINRSMVLKTIFIYLITFGMSWFKNWFDKPSIPVAHIVVPPSSPNSSGINRVEYPGWDDREFRIRPWEWIGRKDNVDTYVKQVPGSKLLAFRGVSFMDVHISQALGPFLNVTHSLEWVSMLKHIELLNLTSQSECAIQSQYCTVDLLYQILKLPWPISPRDILIARHFKYNTTIKQVEINYYSVDDARRPVSPNMIRAVSPHSMWRFTAMNDDDILITQRSSDAPLSQSSYSSSFKNQSASTTTSTDNIETAISLSKLSFRQLLQSWKTKFTKLFIQGWQKMKELIKLEKKIVSKLESKNFTENIPKTETTITADDTENNSCVIDQHILQGKKSTKVLVEVETAVDSKGSIPIWFINFMQRQWPAMTLNTFRQLAKKGVIQPHPSVLCW